MKFIFTSEQDQFIIDNLGKLGTRKISLKFNISKNIIRKRSIELGLQNVLTENSQRSLIQKGDKLSLGRKMTPAQYKAVLPNLFKKGHVPKNKKEIGSKRLRKEGYSEIKTENGFELEQRVIWRKNFGEIPDGHVIIFKDKDITNLSPDNLECISMDENCIINCQTGNYPRDIQKLDYTRYKLQRKIKEINGTK